MLQNCNDKNGVIFNIQEYAVHDGPGIRTAVFLKGCPLRCAWCCNPEGQDYEPEVMVNQKSSDKNIIGKHYTSKFLYNKIISNLPFFKNSGGGITLSGGEPLAQPKFAGEFLKLCKKTGLSVGVETCGYFEWEKVKDFISKFDFYYFDIKTTDAEKHKRFTGKDNKIILENLKKLAKINPSKITVTIAVIPAVNDSEKEISGIIKICKDNKISKIRFLPYHFLGRDKYEALGRKYPMKNTALLKHSEMEHIKNLILKSGIKCRIE